MSTTLASLTAAAVLAAGISSAQAGLVWRFPYKSAPYMVQVPDAPRAGCKTSYKYAARGTKEQRTCRRIAKPMR